MGEGGSLAGNAGGAGAVHRPVAHYLAILVLIHGGRGGAGGGFTGVYKGLQTVLFPVQQPEAAPAHTGRIGFDHRQGSCHGHGRIEGITALLENVEPGFCSQRVGAGHRVLARPGRLGGNGDQQQ